MTIILDETHVHESRELWEALSASPRKRVERLTHWQHYDSPGEALCGATITPEEIGNPPTCPVCAERLLEMMHEGPGLP